MNELKCEVCGFESNNLDEVCYYNINGWGYDTEFEIENNLHDPDALAHVLCNDCYNEFEF